MGKTCLAVVLASFLAAACSTTPEPAPEPAPVSDSMVAWPSVPIPEDGAAAAAAPKSEFDELRESNRLLLEQVAALRAEVQAKLAPSEPRAAAAAAPEEVLVSGGAPAAAPAPVNPAVVLENVRGALRKAGVAGIEVSSNAEGHVVLTMPGAFSFGAGKADLSPEAKTSLDRLGALFSRDLPGVSLRVEGHTDADPIRRSKWASNEALSAARADAVAAALVAGGVPPDRIRTAGLGAARPVASNVTAEGKARNRRVEIVVLP